MLIMKFLWNSGVSSTVESFEFQKIRTNALTPERARVHRARSFIGGALQIFADRGQAAPGRSLRRRHRTIPFSPADTDLNGREYAA